MMQLVCNGSRLDLYENTDLQFTDENPLFAFDSIKCERTTNFKLPATPANDRVFALARIPAYAGEGMRRKFTAQLQMGTIVKDGYLYVSSWSGKEYEAIFVTGEMVGLKRIKDAGKLKDLIQESDRLIWNEANTHGANSTAGRAKYAITRYKTDAALCLPSFDLADIIEDASFGIITPSLQLDKRNWRVVAPKAEPIDERQVTMEFLGTDTDPSSSMSSPQLARSANISGLSWLGSYASQTILVFINNAQRYYAVRQFVCGQDIMLTFPEDFSDDIFLMSFGTDAMYNTLKTEYFLGGYSFANNTTTGQGIVRYGTPLAKKSVRINARTPFTFVNASDYDYNRNAPQVEGFRWLGNGNLTATFKAEGIEAKEGDYVMLHDILPDITLADALRVYAYLRGEQLYYTDKDGVQFDDLFFISWPRFDISKRLLSIGKVTRTFSDYAQHNLVQFDSADDVPQNTRVITEYTLDNDNISESKEVGKIPFNEGEIDAADGVIVARFDAEDVEKNTLPKYGIAVAGQSQFMERVQLPKNAGIQALCDASTQVEVQARMSAYEYAQITAKTRILCGGTEYVWTSRSWQKDTAKFVLAKLPPLSWGELLVDMGLPSGTKWCSVDIDVTKKHGFAETPFTYEKSFFSWGNIDGHNPISSGSFAPWSWGVVNSQAPWYQGQVYGGTPGNTLTGNIPTTPEFDAARANLGAPWRMPTNAEYGELFANIRYINADGSEIPASQTNKLVTVNGVVGLYLESTINGARLFFSASGYGAGTSRYNRGSSGNYWSAAWYSARNARNLYFSSGGVYPQLNNNRYYGFAVRAVQ